MNQYFDRNGRMVVAGMTIRHPSGDKQIVYKTQNDEGSEDLGILATNPSFVKHHPDWPAEYFSLSAISVGEWEVETISYGEMVNMFRQFNREHDQNKESICGRIVFSDDSFSEAYSLESRTYVVSSQNKAYMVGMGGYSIYGTSLDGSDPCARLDCLMAEEKGGMEGWKVDYCYLLKD